MAIDYVMPKLAMAMNEGTIAEWLVAHGEKVEKGQPLATIETEKVAYDVESPEAGYLSIVVEAGETVPCDTLIARFADTAEAAVISNRYAPEHLIINTEDAAALADSVRNHRAQHGDAHQRLQRGRALDLAIVDRLLARGLAPCVVGNCNAVI